MNSKNNKLNLLISFLKFQFIITCKWIGILFKKNRQLTKISVDYFKNWHLENSFLLAYIKFNNAIYYKVGTTRGVNFNKPVIIDLQHINTEIIIIKVYGFRKKQVIKIEIEKELYLNTQLFETSIKNINPIEIQKQTTTTKFINYKCKFGKPQISLPIPSVNPNHLVIKYNNFKTQDFL